MPLKTVDAHKAVGAESFQQQWGICHILTQFVHNFKRSECSGYFPFPGDLHEWPPQILASGAWLLALNSIHVSASIQKKAIPDGIEGIMARCVIHPDREAFVICSKMRVHYCRECLDTCEACTDPCGYCKDRTQCIIFERFRKSEKANSLRGLRNSSG
jgi:hypothetical protein